MWNFHVDDSTKGRYNMILGRYILKLEVFQYATSLDLNMGYYHIQLRNNSSNLCMIILHWGKYRYKRLTMGIVNSPDFFHSENERFIS